MNLSAGSREEQELGHISGNCVKQLTLSNTVQMFCCCTEQDFEMKHFWSEGTFHFISQSEIIALTVCLRHQKGLQLSRRDIFFFIPQGHLKFSLFGRNKLLRGLMKVRICDIRAINHVLQRCSFFPGGFASISEVEQRKQHAELVHTNIIPVLKVQVISLPPLQRGSHANVIIVLSKRHSCATSKRADQREGG